MPSQPEADRPPGSVSPTQPAGVRDRCTCVLWHCGDAAGGGPEGGRSELIATLKNHGASVLACTDAFSALAHACRLTSSKSGARGAVLLILVQPERLPGVTEFAQVVRRYVPRSALWWYDHKGKPPLKSVTSSELMAWSASPTIGAPPHEGDAIGQAIDRRGAWATGGKPKLRLTEPIEAIPPPAPAPATAPMQNLIDREVLAGAQEPAAEARRLDDEAGGAEAPPAHVLTADELAMLLGEEPGSEGGPGHEGPGTEGPAIGGLGGKSA